MVPIAVNVVGADEHRIGHFEMVDEVREERLDRPCLVAASQRDRDENGKEGHFVCANLLSLCGESFILTVHYSLNTVVSRS